MKIATVIPTVTMVPIKTIAFIVVAMTLLFEKEQLTHGVFVTTITATFETVTRARINY